MDDDLKIVLDDLGICLEEPPGLITTIFTLLDATGVGFNEIVDVVQAEREAYAAIAANGFMN